MASVPGAPAFVDSSALTLGITLTLTLGVRVNLSLGGAGNQALHYDEFQAERRRGSSVWAVPCSPWHAFHMVSVPGAPGFVVFSALTPGITPDLSLV